MTYKKGHPVSQKLRDYLSRIHKGKHYSPATEFEKGHPSNKGRKFGPMTPEQKERVMHNLIHASGSDNPNWRGGVSSLRDRIEDTNKYKDWRTAIFTRDEFTCQSCGAKNGEGKTIRLEAHHVDEMIKIIRRHNIHSVEQALQYKVLWDLENGKTLCEDCHAKTKIGVAT